MAILQGIKSLIWGPPTGTIIAYMGTVAPDGYIFCDGSTKNISDYPNLAAHFQTQFGSKNYFGGNGTTTFAVPDLRGEFLRGTGTNSHTNQGSGVNVGEHQDATSIMSIFSNDSNNRLYYHTGQGVNNEDWSESATGGYSTPSASTATNAGKKKVTLRPTNTSVLYCIKY